MSIQSDLLAEVEKYIAASLMAETNFGKIVVNDGKLVSRLRSGENMTLRTLERVRDYLDAHRSAVRAPEQIRPDLMPPQQAAE